MTVIRILDIENENHQYLGDKAGSPRHPDNYIVQAAWRDDKDGRPGEVVGHRFQSKEQEESTKWFSLAGVDILVCHNAAHELKWFLNRHRAETLKFIKRGGRVLCTALGHYLLSHQTDLYPSLDETAPVYGGTHKVDGIKAMWEAGYLTSQIDPELLWEYLAGPEGDVENTAVCFYGEMRQMVEQGMWNMFLARCDNMVALALCMDAGLKVDMEVAERNLAEAAEELEGIQKELNHLVPEDLPAELDFNWGSNSHLSALLFGGPVKYKARVSYDPKKYVKADFYKRADDGALIRCEEVQDNPQYTPRLVKYASGKNKGLPKVFREDTAEEKLKLADALYWFDGLINVQKLPASVREKFRNPQRGRKGEFVTNVTLGDNETPVYSTGSNVIETLGKHGFEAAELLARKAKVDKDIGSFYRKVEYAKDGSVKRVKGMLQYVSDDGFIHHSLNNTSTSTGRLSCTSPNLQQLPRDGTSKVKEMFVSRFGEDGVIIEIDYSALEVVMLAALSGDDNLLEKLMAGTDMHCLRLAAKEGMPYDEVYKLCHEEGPHHKEWKQKRTDIKAPSFAAQYGASAAGIAFATGVSLEFAEEFLATEAKLFPQSIAYRQVIRDQVEKTGGRKIQREVKDDGSWGVYRRGYFQSPGGTCYSFREHPQWQEGEDGRKREVMDYKDTQIANYPIQGEAGYLMAVSLGRAGRWLVSKDFYSNSAFPEGRVFLINNVHDAIYIDAHKSVAREAGEAIKSIMEDAPKYMSKYLGYDIADVPFPAEAEWGHSMYEKHPLNTLS